MTDDQIWIFAILTAALAMFLFGRWRHDMVALAALLAVVLSGLVEAEAAFAGFGHPAVITVACVLVLSRGLQLTGAVDIMTRTILPAKASVMTSLLALSGLGAFLSSFMNNVGALALLMPVAIQVSRRLSIPPGLVLMPLSFGTILGGMTTMIGTPPNLIVANFRRRTGAEPFGMFDFTPVGLAVALAGLAFVVLIGWRLIPSRQSGDTEAFDPGAYLTEVELPENSKAAGMTLHDLEVGLQEAGGQIIALVRNGVYLAAPRPSRIVQTGDILVVEADATALPELLDPLGLVLVAAKVRKAGAEDETQEPSGPLVTAPSDLLLREFVVRPDSSVSGSTAADLGLRSRYGVNLLAVSRGGRRSATRLRTWRIRAGDMLLLQGTAEALSEFTQDAGFVPLAARELRLPQRRMALLATLILAASVGLTALEILPPEVAFSLGFLASMVFRTVPPREVYQSIDWSVIVLLAALIPVAGAMETTGAAGLIASALIGPLAQGSAIIALGLILIITMTLSDLMNNAATAAVMCPIAIGAAQSLGVNPDSFLMAVAIGASCAFLTPIGHQNNTLILGPGGFRFGDYWRMGLPLEIVVVCVALPLMLLVWPL